MKLYRFMSPVECANFLKGEILVNKTDHSQERGAGSTAKGFCFGIGAEEQAKKDLRRLCGIVNTEILMVFEPKDIDKFTPCQGRYVDYEKIDAEGKTIDDYPIMNEPHKYFDEYCTEEYSLNDFEDYHVYHVCHYITKDLFGTECWMLQELDIEKSLECLTGDEEYNQAVSLSEEIIDLLHKHKGVRVGQAIIALAYATSNVIDIIVENGDATPQRCFDIFVDMLKSSTFSDKEK